MMTIQAVNESWHDQLVALAKSSPYTKDFSNRLMFSSDDAYRKGWICGTFLTEPAGTRQLKPIAMSCVRHKTRVPETMLYFVVVHPKYRQEGHAMRLLRWVMLRSPHDKMALNVMKDNKPALAFYAKNGFQVDGEAMQGEALRMSRIFP